MQIYLFSSHGIVDSLGDSRSRWRRQRRRYFQTGCVDEDELAGRYSPGHRPRGKRRRWQLRPVPNAFWPVLSGQPCWLRLYWNSQGSLNTKIMGWTVSHPRREHQECFPAGTESLQAPSGSHQCQKRLLFPYQVQLAWSRSKGTRRPERTVVIPRRGETPMGSVQS